MGHFTVQCRINGDGNGMTGGIYFNNAVNRQAENTDIARRTVYLRSLCFSPLQFSRGY